jgi:uncharacterized protein
MYIGQKQAAEKKKVLPRKVEKKTSFQGKTYPVKPGLYTGVLRPKGPARPKIAIVIDDFGYRIDNLNGFFEIGTPFTFSILPNLEYSKKIAGAAHAKGYEVILHLPLEPQGKSVRLEKNTIMTSMTRNEIIRILDDDIASVPGLKGVSNHMGSKATEDMRVMTAIIRHISGKNLYYFDSRSTSKSVSKNAAALLKAPFVERDIFLDNEDGDYIRKQIVKVKELALKQGRAVAVCNDRKGTLEILREMIPKLAAEGIDFVFLSEFVE